MALVGNLLGTVDGVLGTVEGLLGGVTGSLNGTTGSVGGLLGGAAATTNTLDLDPTHVGTVIETNPSLSLSTPDIAGTGGLDLSVSAPTMVGVTADVGHLDVGGLLHGLV
jgi:hypothetical protein